MRYASAVIAALAAGMALTPAWADMVKLGISAPLSGASDVLGRQIVAGASAAAAGTATSVVDDGCTAAGGAEAARKFVADEVSLVVGFLCGESIDAALPILKEAGIRVITPGVRIDSLTDRRAKTRYPVYRLAPRDDSEGEAVAAQLTQLWKEKLFAIVDDGTIHGRDLAETFRIAAEQSGLKPVFIDTYRPQMDNQIGLLGRLRKAGATHVFVGGDRDDIAIMGRDAAGLDAGMTFAGGEALRAAGGDVPLAVGTLMIGLPEWSDLADPSVIAALSTQGIVPEGYVLPAYAATQIALAAAAATAADSTAGPAPLTDAYPTVIGTIRFDEKGDLSGNPYRLFSFDGAKFVPVETQ